MKKGQNRNNQNGMASIIVVMTLMVVLALISIGFSRLMNREVRQSLDRQLSTAAYYAAESGVNDARDFLADPHGGSNDIKDCKIPGGAKGKNFVDNGDISGAGLFTYSCILVDSSPKELQFDIPAGQSKVVQLSGAQLKDLSRLYLGWQNSGGYKDNDPNPLGPYAKLPQQGSVGVNDTGLLRVAIYPMVDNCNDTDAIHGNRYTFYGNALGGNGPGADKADAAIECAARNYFLYPASGPGTAPNCGYAVISASNGCVNYDNADNDGAVVPGDCIWPGKTPATTFANQATPVYCNAMVNNLLPVKNGGNSADSYYVRLTAVYQSLKVFIEATDNSGTPKALQIENAEAVIDVTGTGNDISRRIQTRAPLQDQVPQLNFSLQSMESLCKLFRNDVVQPGIYNNARLDPAAAPYNTDRSGTNCSYPLGSNNIDSGGLPPISLTPPPTAHIHASPNNVDEGDASTLTWDSTDADSCTGSGFSTGPGSPPSSAGGGASTGALTSNKTYTVTCTGPSGTDSDSVTVTVNLRCKDKNADNYGAIGACKYTCKDPGADNYGEPGDCHAWITVGIDNLSDGHVDWHYDIHDPSGTGDGIDHCNVAIDDVHGSVGGDDVGTDTSYDNGAIGPGTTTTVWCGDIQGHGASDSGGL